MLHSRQPWQSYRQVSLQTASRGQLVLMLYDGAIRFLECSLKGFDMDDPGEQNSTINNNIVRAQDIIRELDNSLNMEGGGELASTLRRLYHYFEWRLTESNLHKTPTGIREVIDRLTSLREAWATALQGPRSDAAAGIPAPALR